MHKTDIRNHYVMSSEAFPWRHLRIFRIVQTKELNNSPAFLTVIPNKSGRLLVTVIEAGGGGALASINNR